MDTKYLKNVLIYIGSAVVSVLFIFYLCYHLYGSFGTDVETVLSESVTRAETLTFNAYIMRDEDLLYSNHTGDVNYLCEDGEKIAVGASIADIYASGSSSLRSQIKDIDTQINILKLSSPSGNNTSIDTSLIDSQINQLYHMIRNSIESGNTSYVLQKKNELLILLNKRNIIVKSVLDYDDQIAALEEERARLTSRLETVSETVVTSKSGYFYSAIDGYENIFSSQKVQDLTLEKFQEMKSSAPESTYVQQEGYAVGKLVTTYEWYAVCETTKETLRYFQTGAIYPVRYPYSSDIEISMTLEKIITDNSTDQALLVFRTGEIPENFNYLRMQTIEVVRQNYSGLGVPASAVRVVDGQEGVYTLIGNVVKFRKIDTLFEEEGYFIVKNYTPTESGYSEHLKRNELIIVKGKNLYDGKIIQ